LCLPTGGGMALVFFRDPMAPVQCAIQIGRALRGRPHLSLRMGVHTGPVDRMEEINANVSGGGIYVAQRVMDCGDAGHILLSSAMRELLRQVGDWPVHDLGEAADGERLHLFNLYTDEIGNPAVPEKLRAAFPVSKSTEPEPQPQPVISGQRVAILYKRGAQPDEQLLQLLETQLSRRGFQIFIDRHLAIGVEWAKAIERQIRTSDVVIPLL